MSHHNKPHYFAPGTIDAGDNSPQTQRQADWVLVMRWYDWLAGLVIVMVIGAIAGMAA
jgi:hypothetical protein